MSCPGRARILLAGSDQVWAGEVGEMLRDAWFAVEITLDDAAAMSQVTSFQPDLVGVDISPSRCSPTVLISSVRRCSTAAIVAFGLRNPEADVLAALGAGADTFVPKDTSHRQLLARLRALLRRFPPVDHGPARTKACGPIEFDVLRRRATVAGHDIGLVGPELDVLEALLRAPGRAVSRRALMTALKSSKEGDIDLHVRRLRQKIEAWDPQRRIVAVRGVGFRFEPIEVPVQ